MQRVSSVFAAAIYFFTLAAGQAQLSNRPAPPFRLPDATGGVHQLSDYQGKVVLLHFANTADPEFLAFSEKLGAAQKKHPAKLAVLVAAVFPDTAESVSRFAAQKKPPYTLLFDGSSSAVVTYLSGGQGVPRIAVPHLFLIDAAGYIRDDFNQQRLKSKFAPEGALERFVEAYLN